MDRNTAIMVAKQLYPGYTESMIQRIMADDPLDLITELEQAEAEKSVIDAVWAYV